MPKSRLMLYFLLGLLSIQASFGADLNKLNKLFKDTFWTIYQPNYCGRNIESLGAEAVDRRINLKNAFVMEIRNAGFDMFGMVAAISAREEGRLIEPKPSRPPFRHTGTNNWHFHVVMLADGYVYDYDFMNEATVLKLEDYLDRMYIPQKEWKNREYKLDKVGAYEISLYPVESYLQEVRNRQRTTATIKEVRLRNFIPAYFK